MTAATEHVEPSRYSKAILYALVLTGKHVYAGTVSAPEKARRRKRAKAARVARRVSRSRA